jgi:SAM-dependent methyltransferase
MAEFDRFAGSYRAVLDGSVGSAAYFAEGKALWLRDQLGADFAGRVLDFGCGIGLLCEAILRALPGVHLTGFDVSADSLASVPASVRTQAQLTSDEATIGDSYDLIVISNVLHHVPLTERDGLLAALVARLAPAGRLVVFEHNPLNPMTRWVVAHCPFDDDAVLLWPAETLERLARAGLGAPQRAWVAFLPPALGRWRSWERHLQRLPLGAQYVAWGSRP